MLYNDYVLKDKQNQIINKDIYNLMMVEDKPEDGKLFINEYGNVSIVVKIDDRCYKKDYNEDTVNLIEEDCNI